ncbi:kinase-like domain-containing protein, partial [Mycena amicta]
MHRDANAFRRFFSASSTSAPDGYHGLSLVRTDALDIVRSDGPTPTPEPALASSPAALFLSAFSPVAAPSKPVATDEAGSLVGGFTLGPIIAHGAFSTIRRATALTTGAVVAVKIVPRAATLAVPARRRLENEESVWSSLSHEHILPLFAAIHTPTHDFFVTQLCPAGSLFDIMRGGIPGRDDAGRMFRQIVRGLRYLHCEKRLVHRDIKLENVLVDEAGVCRIADFGMARSVDGDEDDVNQDDNTEALPPIHLGRAASLAGPRGASIRRDRTASVPASAAAPSSTTETEFQPGSLPYAAPELLGPPKSSLTSSLSLSSKGRHSYAIPITSPSRPDPAQDIWALGVLLYALLTGNLPFSDAFEPRLVLKILGGTYPAPPPSTPRGTLAVLRGCLAPRVADRWNVEKVDECAWAVG